MAIEIKVNDSLDPKPGTLPMRRRVPDPADTCGDSADGHTLEQGRTRRRRRAVFYANRAVGAPSTPTLTLTLPAAGTWVNFGLGGKPGKPSVNDHDCLWWRLRRQRPA